MSDRIGVAILAYYGLDDLKRAVESVHAHTPDCEFVVFDNSENLSNVEWLMAERVPYVRSPYNVGCAVSRNRIAEHMLARGIEYFVVIDQDVTVQAGWLPAMRAVFDAHPDTGIVSWSLFTKQMGPGYKPDPTGIVPEMPGACCMYSAECVRNTGGWCPQYFAYRFDSDFCLCAGKAGFKTRIVQGECRVAHNHPHQGVMRHPRMAQVQRESQALFVRRMKELGIHVPQLGA